MRIHSSPCFYHIVLSDGGEIPEAACDAVMFAADVPEYRGERDRAVAKCGEF
jgi:hypothetical protein